MSWTGPASDDEDGAHLGSTLTALGDLDGDGRFDLLFGAPSMTGPGEDRDVGWIYVVLGRPRTAGAR